MTDDLVRISRLLAFVLRHQPDRIGITLDGSGWVDIETLLAALASNGRPVSRSTLDLVAAGTDKPRFEIRDGRIRAAQGHSIPVDLRLEPQAPPAVLYHGTVARLLPRILAGGLRRGRRHHVHLSGDEATAARVGRRRGEPVVLRIDAAAMHRHGYTFYRAANGVWLTDHVPPQWIVTP